MGLIAILIPFINLGSHILQLTLHYLRMFWDCLNAQLELWSLLCVYNFPCPLTLLHYSSGYLGMLKYLIAGVVTFIGLGSHPLLLPLHYLGGFLRLFKCSFAAMVPSVSLGSNAL